MAIQQSRNTEFRTITQRGFIPEKQEVVTCMREITMLKDSIPESFDKRFCS